ncbi:MAG: DUF560 domain-containing protein [Chloroflexi bacterium]|nr:DUF560 domain-containing protein [Chloroflexota bacterium]
MMRTLFRASACTALLLLSVPAWSVAEESGESAAGSPNVVEITASEVRSLIDSGRYNEALRILRPLQPDSGSELSLLFLFGLAATGASQNPALPPAEREALLDEAIAAFRAMLIDRPELVRVRLELARAFFFKGEDDLSRRHFEHVLAGNPPEAVVANVRRFLAQIRARKRWTLHAGFALAPDTNIGGGSAERFIDIGGLPFRRDAEELTTSGIGLAAWAGGEYQLPLNPRLRLRSGGNVSRRDYAGSQFDSMFLSGHVGPRWFVSVNSEISVLATVQRNWYGNVPNFDALGGRIESRHRFTRRLTGYGQASWLDRQYRSRTYLDGPVANVSLSGYWVVTPTLRANAGLGWGRERPESERWRHERQWLRAGVEVAFPRGYTLGASGELRSTDYEGNWFPNTRGGVPRQDRTRSVRLSLHNRALSWNGFSPQISLVHEIRDTNAQLYDYKRTGGELRVVRLF